jgi:SAM-dependent methyltransferase
MHPKRGPGPMKPYSRSLSLRNEHPGIEEILRRHYATCRIFELWFVRGRSFTRAWSCLRRAGPGCGDGHFASAAFDHPLDVGLDPWWGPLLEARTRSAYRMLVRSDGAKIPFPNGAFASVVTTRCSSTSPPGSGVDEVARVIRPGGPLFLRA